VPVYVEEDAVYDDEDNHRAGHCSDEDSCWAAQCNMDGARFNEQKLGQRAL
jgi:hypothetical protein